ncbi:hypothetical protein GMST_40430 [Geomonas silvestris]|uniref:Lipoprotein n=1 Tax=Geomonas silvestris TaxID=2740184 RepID=A0A6V8MNU9_9BACT|nr:hypothetical protein [Geomonas silvestris]GFO61718.1 hypothetical protein GMST_40430 [Geomonas silvestris]
MRSVLAVIALALFSAVAHAEEWTQVGPTDTRLSAEYSKASLQSISPTVKRVKTRIVSKVDDVHVFTVVTETEFYCPQPLEKLLSAKLISAAGEVTSEEKVDSPVFYEMPRGTNSFRLWEAICSAAGTTAK